jgi:hypothetical protein
MPTNDEGINQHSTIIQAPVRGGVSRVGGSGGSWVVTHRPDAPGAAGGCGAASRPHGAARDPPAPRRPGGRTRVFQSSPGESEAGPEMPALGGCQGRHTCRGVVSTADPPTHSAAAPGFRRISRPDGGGWLTVDTDGERSCDGTETDKATCRQSAGGFVRLMWIRRFGEFPSVVL